ncbi:MAG: PDZ domain-containing protein, partial [Candidatus Dormibacteria bacterium]
ANVRQHGAVDGVRYRLARWTRDGESFVTVSDETGEDMIEVHHAGAKETTRRLDGLDIGLVLDIAVSPVADQLALVNQRNELLLVDLKSATLRRLDRSDDGPLQNVTWSPDGRWLAYSCATFHETRSIKLWRAETDTTHLVTAPQFVDFCPSWSPDGKYLFFLSARVFDPVVDTVFFDYGFPRATRPYAVTLRNDLRSPFLGDPRSLKEGQGETGDDVAVPGGHKAKKTEKPPEVRIDLDGIGTRVVEFPVEEGLYDKVVAIPGKVLLLSRQVSGTLGQNRMGGGPPSTGTLEAWDMVERRKEPLTGEVSTFEVSADGSTLVYASNNRLRALPAGAKPPEGPDGAGPPGRKSGWIDLDRVRVSVDPASEWRQMYSEAWRLQREFFWMADMSGVDWRRVHDRYFPLIERVGCRSEFSDLMWEMQGELGTSHAYEIGGDYRPVPAYPMGFLGADLELDRRSGRWRVARLVRGDPWDAKCASPLQAPGVNVQEGDFILAINGRPVGPDLRPAQLLVNQAGQPVELTVARSARGAVRQVLVTTLADEVPLRYREWVDQNRDRVHAATGGRVGYVHIPDMGANGFAEFHRTYFSEVDHEALIVDVRNNGGGHVSQILLERLARKRLGYDVQRYGPDESYPSLSPAGPLVCITDENAGSDGDIFTHTFKLMKLGPVVGKRTWGGVIGINPRHLLADGSVTTQPQFSFWFNDVGWGVENYGTDPDFDVDVRPQDWAAGKDPQMDKALQLVKAALKKHRPLRPDVDKRPRLTLPELPPR